ncbi:hypothetical protein H1R20_g11199, partial [Candolleomyces eurysporus]
MPASPKWDLSSILMVSRTTRSGFLTLCRFFAGAISYLLFDLARLVNSSLFIAQWPGRWKSRNRRIGSITTSIYSSIETWSCAITVAALGILTRSDVNLNSRVTYQMMRAHASTHPDDNDDRVMDEEEDAEGSDISTDSEEEESGGEEETDEDDNGHYASD